MPRTGKTADNSPAAGRRGTTGTVLTALRKLPQIKVEMTRERTYAGAKLSWKVNE
jgi:hypothetical protein